MKVWPLLLCLVGCVSSAASEYHRQAAGTPGDRDGDHVPDTLDMCPDDPEDMDGFEDEDGCPDVDNDRDGVLDPYDRCPNAPGASQNFGCPVEG